MPHRLVLPDAVGAALSRRAAPERQILCQTIVDPWSRKSIAAMAIAQVAQPSPKKNRAASNAAHKLQSIIGLYCGFAGHPAGNLGG
jgi:hypothetical protein